MNGTAGTSTPAQIVLFDLGHVIVDWQPVRIYYDQFKTPEEAEAFCRDICNLAWHTEHDRGVSFAENARRLVAKHPQYEPQIRTWRTRWLEMFTGYVDGMPGIVAALEARRIPLYGLSNLPAEIAQETFDAFPLIKVLRDVIVSGAEGVVKPDPKIYEIALDRMGSPDPAHVLFVDDRRENVDAANRLGFQTHHFQGADRLKTDLQTQGLL